MSESARVTSIVALREFRAALDVFKDDASDAICSAAMEIRRVQEWLDDRLMYWQKTRRRCQEAVSEAKNVLQSRKMFKVFDKPPDCTEQEKALATAKRRLEEAEDKIERCKEWIVRLKREIEEYEGPIRRLNATLEGEIPHATSLLDRMAAALEAYTQVAIDRPKVNPAPPSEEKGPS